MLSGLACLSAGFAWSSSKCFFHQTTQLRGDAIGEDASIYSETGKWPIEVQVSLGYHFPDPLPFSG